MRRVTEKINDSNERLKSVAARCKNLDDGTFNFSNINCLRPSNRDYCNIRQIEVFANTQISQGAAVVACVGLSMVLASGGLVGLIAAAGVVVALLLSVTVVDIIIDWSRAPPLQKDVDKLIDELL